MEYVSKVTLAVNGQEITDFSAVTEKEVDLRREVRLMAKTGVAAVTERYGIEVDYVIPKSAPEFDFAAVADGTLTINRMNGTVIQFGGVSCMRLGAIKYDGEKEATRTIEFIATTRVTK